MSNAAAAPSILAPIDLAVAAGQPVVEVFAALGSTEAGLSSAEVYHNEVKDHILRDHPGRSDVVATIELHEMPHG